MKESKVVDSSVWLDYFFNGNHQEIIDAEEIFLLSSLELYEIKKKLMKSKISEAQIIKSIDFIKKKSLILPVSIEIAENAVMISLDHDLSIVDAVIYATALENDAVLITKDNDFRGLKKANVI